jgi:hypothetical protein
MPRPLALLALFFAGCVTKEDELASLDRDGDGFLHPAAEALGEAGPFDCDDADDSVHPEAAELCDGFDQDCDGTADEDLVSGTWYPDADGDGFGDDALAEETCAPRSGWIDVGGDCVDSDDAVHPEAAEVCNGEDDDCDGTPDDGLTVSTWYLDADADGFGVDAETVEDCGLPQGYAAASGDCDDTSDAVWPGASEVPGNEADDDCDGAEVCWFDGDDDTYGGSSTIASDDLDCGDQSEAITSSDCDDSSSTVSPDGSETCNGVDDDCDGAVDDGVSSTWFVDADEDGFGTSATITTCGRPSGTATVSGDCDDASAEDYPGAAEIAVNGDDEDCDAVESCYDDADEDGYGSDVVIDSADMDCDDASESGLSGDCDDSNASRNPGAADTPYDGVDSDCAGDDDYDADGDGVTAEAYGGEDCDDAEARVHPGAWDGPGDTVDQNCDGEVDAFVLSRATTISSGGSTADAEARIDWADLDGDTNTDLLYCNGTSGGLSGLYVFLGGALLDTDNSFTAADVAVNTYPRCSLAVTADLGTADGVVDVAVSDRAGTVQIVSGADLGAGSWSTISTISSSSGSATNFGWYLEPLPDGVFTTDARGDLAVSDMTAASVYLFDSRDYRSAGTAITEADAAALLDLTGGQCGRHLAHGDIDGDGLPELAVTCDDVSKLYVFAGADLAGGATLTDADSLGALTAGVGSSTNLLLIEDFTTDGYADVHTLVDTTGFEAAFFDAGDLTTTMTRSDAWLLISEPGENVGLGGSDSADVDGDGALDIALTSTGGTDDRGRADLFLAPGATSGTLGHSDADASWFADTGSGSRLEGGWVWLHDLDGDAKPDLTLATSGGVALFRNPW